MTDSITVTGVVGSDPRVHVTTQGLAITSFRLASTRRYFDRAKGTWEDGETNWYTVSGFRQLAQNTAASVRKGDRVVVQGRLRLRAWESGEKSGTAIEIEADSIGHDLAWGTTTLTKVRRESATRGRHAGRRRLRGRGMAGVEASSERRRCRSTERAAPGARRGRSQTSSDAVRRSTTRSSRSPGDGERRPDRPDERGRHRLDSARAVATAGTRGTMARRLDITAVLALAGAALVVGVTGCTRRTRRRRPRPTPSERRPTGARRHGAGHGARGADVEPRPLGVREPPVLRLP